MSSIIDIDNINNYNNNYNKNMKENEDKNENENLNLNLNLNEELNNDKKYIINTQNSNTKSLYQFRKKRSFNKISHRSLNQIDVILEIYTKIMKKDDAEICICHNFLDDELDEIRNNYLKTKEINESKFLTENKNSKNKLDFNTNLNINDNNNHNNNNNNDIHLINNEYKGYFYEREIISSMNLPNYGSDKVKVLDVIKKLKTYGYPLTGSMISVYSQFANDYVFIGADPIDKNFYLNNREYDTKIIKLRILVFLEEKIIPDINFENNSLITVSRKNSVLDKTRLKRTKERKIGYIIEKVNSWRKLYNGFYDINNKFTKYSLEDAAKIIGISKKSLDDYLLQLRLGRKFGFDFNSKRNERVGILRTFVKMSRKNINKNDL